MELRWLEGDCKFGRYKLQFREKIEKDFYEPNTNIPFSSFASYTKWIDVPIEKKKQEESLEVKFLKLIADYQPHLPGGKQLADELSKIAEEYYKPKNDENGD